MRKRIVSLLLSLALCLTLLPTAAFAEEAQPEELLPGEQLEQVQPVQEEPEENEEQSQQDEDVIAVQEMIKALPDASALDEMDEAAQESACLAASEAYEVYDALTKEQQSALTGVDNMLDILEWATRQVTPLDDTTTGTEHQSHPICGKNCTHTGSDTHEGVTWTGVDSLDRITVKGNYYLTKDVTLTKAWECSKDVNLCLNGHSITVTAAKDAIIVKSGTFTLTDCKNTGEITHATGQTGRGVTVDTGGTFHMYGGSIADNTAKSGGGVYVGTSTFHMYGGSISGNTAESGNGGGVYMAGGEFTMSGGTIENNTATDPNTNYGKGGGVYINRGSFTMTGGSITNNTALNFGGVCVGENATAFTVGGNVAVTGNKSSGTANDVYLYSGKSITVDGKLDSTARIGVTCAAIDSGAFVTVATGAKGSCTEGNFTANKGEPYCIKVEQGADANRVNVNLYNGQPHTHCVCGKTDCTGAGHNNSTVWKGVSSLTDITEAGNYYLTKDVTLTSTWKPADGVKLCLNGHTITTTANVDAIEVGQNVTFTLTNCKDTGKITHQYTDQNYVRMATGCGAYVNGGTFHLYGGTFSKNTGHNSGRITNGGGVYVESGTFYMYGGSITGNSAGNINDNTYGGGVYLSDDGGTFHMSGGSIIGNSSGKCGGGVYVGTNSTFTLSGSASITGNLTKDSGGGVYMYGGRFDMQNGTITGNKADTGGGVHVRWSGTFHMSGGSITGNNVKNNNGGGVNLAGGSFTVSGSASITGNVKGGSESNGIYTGGTANNVGLKSDSSITIGDGLTGTARIGVSLDNNYPSSGNRTQIATNATGNVDYTKIFTPDVTGKGYEITKDDSGNLYLSAHQHRWTYAQGSTTDTITAKCNATGCPASDGGSVTISAPTGLIYDGTAKEAMLDTTSGSWQGGDVSIVYKKGEETFSAAPTDAGTYTASITLGDATASVEYTIAKATPTINWQSYPHNKNFTGSEIANPPKTDIKIHDGKNNDLDLFTEIAFKWYEATKNGGNYTKANETPLTANPIDAGDYIIEATIAATNNTESATITKGLTVNKATNLGGYDKTVPVAVDMYPSSAEKVYTVDLDKILAEKEIRSGGSLALYETVGIQTQSNWVNSAVLEGTTVKITMKALPSTNTGLTATVNVNLTSRNYQMLPVEITLTLQKKPTVNDITVSMDDWTYGGTANTPEYTVPGDVKATVTYAKADGTDLSERPNNAGDYTVTVSYETATEIHTGTKDFTIRPKTLTKDDLTYSGQITKVYDTNTNAPSDLTVSVRQDSLVGSDTLAVSGTLKYNSANVNEANQIIFTPTAITTGNYALAATEKLTITEATITKANQATLTVTSTDATYGTDLALTTKGGSGTGEVTYTVRNDTGEATIVDGSKLHPTKAGTVFVTATKTGDNNYEAVTSVAEKITIGRADYNGEVSKTVNIVKGLTTEQTGTLTAADFFPEGQMPDGAKITAWSLTSRPTAILSAVSVDGGKLTYLSAKNIATASEESGIVTIAATNYKDIEAKLIFHPTDKQPQDGFKFENGSVTKIYGDPDFTLAAAGAAAGSAVTYESSDKTVATVDATGKVTILKAGGTVITATAAETADYKQATATYTLTVKKKTVTVKAKDQTAYVGDEVPTLGADSYTVSGLVGGDTLTTQPTVKYVDANGSETTPDKTKTGETIIRASGAAASDNYTISYVDGKLTVSTRPSGGGSRPSTHPVKAEVSKDPDGSVSLSKTNAAKGDKVTVTVKPDRHYEVDEVIVRDSKGKQLAVKDNGDGTFTFEMPADKVTVEPTFSWVNPFADVADSAYYVDAVEWMLKREVTQGTTETTFSPNLNCTRAQIVTFLWRAAGSPEPKGTVGFADVSAGSYYAKAVAWAIENGITGGTGDGLFSPDATCTRAQSAAFLYRAAGSPAVGGSAGFSDVAADAYYAQAVAWAKEHGITDGIGGGLFGSANDCTRAQIAAFLWRLYAEK